MNSLFAISQYRSGDLSVLKDNKWLQYLVLTEETNVNYERVNALKEITSNYLLEYVESTLKILDTYELDEIDLHVLEQVLCWSEVAKGGMRHQRKQWRNRGYNLYVHNVGSSQIYTEAAENDSDYSELISQLIVVHGMAGQYLRGEIPTSSMKKIKSLVELLGNDYEHAKRLMTVLNHCVIGAVNDVLWANVKSDISKVIQKVLNDELLALSLKKKIHKLRNKAIQNGESYERAFDEIHSSIQELEMSTNIISRIDSWLNETELWYVEAALSDFSLEEFIKIIGLCVEANSTNKLLYISFERMMKSLYYDRNGEKRINLYKKRIVEKYLGDLSFTDIATFKFTYENPHVRFDVTEDGTEALGFAEFVFSDAANQLIGFCQEAEKAGVLYEKSIILLYDLFDFRRDQYDRFYNEDSYLETMNQSIDYKKVILEYCVGNTILDIGPGGGALMDLMEQNLSADNIIGVDISTNVIEALNKKRTSEGRKWQVQYGDALDLKEHFELGTVDTVIFCSIIHELYSYIEFEGKQFNHDTIAAALRSAFDVLHVGGRIIIRDGIMTEPEDVERIIQFESAEGLSFLDRYSMDFKGRAIGYDKIGHNRVKMKVNDAMEFLYTYTWGEDSYNHEVNEQFGYFTPSGYKDFITSLFGDRAEIVANKHYLQQGYTIALSPKVKVYDGGGNACSLPDSTCFIVIEKIK